MIEPKGLLAADESNKSANKRFLALNIAETEEMRRQYRQLLLTTPSLASYISGVILYDETFHQKTDNGTPFVQLLQKSDILPGIKVDTGLVPLTNFVDETVTEGLDGLPQRLEQYYKLGARFTKWRAAFSVNQINRLPSQVAIHTNLEIMARYATIAQAAHMVPIVEPEVLYGGDHSIQACKDTLSQVLRVLFELLIAYKVDLSGVILKTSMVMAGATSKTQSTPEEVASSTLSVLHDRVPVEVAGVVFLSGGQTPEQATNNLSAICKSGHTPWPVSFSYSRAVQEPAMQTWAGDTQNTKAAQAAFMQRLAANSAARLNKLS